LALGAAIGRIADRGEVRRRGAVQVHGTVEVHADVARAQAKRPQSESCQQATGGSSSSLQPPTPTSMVARITPLDPAKEVIGHLLIRQIPSKVTLRPAVGHPQARARLPAARLLAAWHHDTERAVSRGATRCPATIDGPRSSTRRPPPTPRSPRGGPS